MKKFLELVKFLTSSASTAIYSRRMRPIALCLFRHNGRILLQPGFDETKQSAYYRPLGGGIDFREHSAEAVVREIQEELGAEVVDLQFLGVIESIFTHNGVGRHEYVFIYDAKFVDETLYEQDEIVAKEGFGTFTAVWRSLDEFQDGSARLVPKGLFDLLKSVETDTH